MKTKLSIKEAILVTSILAASAGSQAATFNYNEGRSGASDVLIGFRNATNATANNYSVVVDAGSLASLTNLSSGQSVTLYSGTNLTSYLNSTGIGWSVLCGTRAGAVWVTRPRGNYYLQTAAWPVNSNPGKFAVEIDNIGDNAVNIAYGSNPNNATSPFNNNTVVVEPYYGDTQQSPYYNSYAYMMSDFISGNPDGDFWGQPSANTSSLEQVSGGGATRSDFYAIGTGSSTYLGYFELSTNLVLTYTAGASPAPAPTLTIQNNNDGSFNINVPTISGLNYYLIETNLAGLSASRSTWPATGDVIYGDGTVQTFNNVSADSARFYSVSIH